MKRVDGSGCVKGADGGESNQQDGRRMCVPNRGRLQRCDCECAGACGRDVSVAKLLEEMLTLLDGSSVLDDDEDRCQDERSLLARLGGPPCAAARQPTWLSGLSDCEHTAPSCLRMRTGPAQQSLIRPREPLALLSYSGQDCPGGPKRPGLSSRAISPFPVAAQSLRCLHVTRAAHPTAALSLSPCALKNKLCEAAVQWRAREPALQNCKTSAEV
ncbi:hypothetical protein L1887_50320 [Cichorium endivia]|nr:hypothetical protein L1887_50320 [Cichorium endivia]